MGVLFREGRAICDRSGLGGLGCNEDVNFGVNIYIPANGLCVVYARPSGGSERSLS